MHKVKKKTMQMNDLILSPISLPELAKQITEIVTKCLQNERAQNHSLQNQDLKATATEPEFITRNEAGKILGISLVTLNVWTKNGIIIGYRIGTRVRYKRAEILEAIAKIRTFKTA